MTDLPQVRWRLLQALARAEDVFPDGLGWVPLNAAQTDTGPEWDDLLLAAREAAAMGDMELRYDETDWVSRALGPSVRLTQQGYDKWKVHEVTQ